MASSPAGDAPPDLDPTDAFPGECAGIPAGVETLEAAPIEGSWPSIDVASDGHIVMAWTSGTEIHAATWSGTAWVASTIEADAQSTWFGAPTIRSRGGETIVAWPELLPSGDTRLVAARDSGAGWDILGTPLGTVRTNDEVALAVDDSGHPAIAWVELLDEGGGNGRIEIARWEGSAWSSLGVQDANPSGGGSVMEPALIAGPDHRLYLAWHEGDDRDEKLIRVRQWDGAAWSPLDDEELDARRRRDAIDPQLAIDRAGRLHVAWSEGSPQAAQVRRWNGSTWDVLGSSLGAVDGPTNARAGGIAVDAAGRTGVVWAEPSNGISRTHVYRHDLTTFMPLGPGAFDPVDGAMGTNDSDIAVDTCGRVIVAWTEHGTPQHVHARAIYQP